MISVKQVLCRVSNVFKNDRWPTEEVKKGHHLFPYYTKKYEIFIEEGILLWRFRFSIPKRLQKKLLSELYQEHPGIVRIKALSRVHA